MVRPFIMRRAYRPGVDMLEKLLQKEPDNTTAWLLCVSC
jgi:hypothetical protein